MTSLNLVPRAGQMILNFGISSSGDDARTVDIPFGTLATEGGSIAIPKALKISIQSSSGIPISGSDVVCQAFKDDQGTQVLGKPFTQSAASSLGPEPVTIGAIFCSDAKSVESRIGGNDASAQTTSAGSDVATTVQAQSIQTQTTQEQSIQAQTSQVQAQTQTQIIIAPTTKTSDTSTRTTRTKTAASSSTGRPQQTTPSPSPAIDPSGSGGKPKTIEQSSVIMMDTGSAPSLQSNAAATSTASAAANRSTLSSATSAASVQSSGVASSSSPAAAQTTSAAYSVHTQEFWTVRRLANFSVLAACYIGWFML